MKAELEQLAVALREYEKAHARWMRTTIFEPDEQTEVKRILDEKRTAYVHAYKAANPATIVI